MVTGVDPAIVRLGGQSTDRPLLGVVVADMFTVPVRPSRPVTEIVDFVDGPTLIGDGEEAVMEKSGDRTVSETGVD
jgi:hypothetical protein